MYCIDKLLWLFGVLYAVPIVKLLFVALAAIQTPKECYSTPWARHSHMKGIGCSPLKKTNEAWLKPFLLVPRWALLPWVQVDSADMTIRIVYVQWSPNFSTVNLQLLCLRQKLFFFDLLNTGSRTLQLFYHLISWSNFHFPWKFKESWFYSWCLELGLCWPILILGICTMD